MKRRISAILLCLALLVGLLPTTALAAVTDSWDLKVHVSENDKVKYGEQNTLEVGFGVQSDNLQLRNLQSVMVAVDLTVFDLISKSGKVMTDKEFGDLKTTEYTEGAGKYVYFGNKFYSENAEEDVNWTTKVYFAKNEVGKIGYVKIEPAQGQDACSVTTEMILSSVLLGFKAGKSKADLKPDSIRIATLEEANKLSNEVVAILTDGNENTQYYGFNPASGYTALKNNPAVVWADGLLPGTTYTVSFNANGGSGEMTPVSGVSGSYTLPANGFTAPTNKQFKGWATSASGTVITGTSITVTADTTLYAIWEPIPVTEYTITFDVNGGSGTIPSQTTSGQKLSSLPAAIHSGSYSFDGWYTAISGGIKITTAHVFYGNTTVYAHWTYIGGGGGGGGGSSHSSRYTITVDKTENGTITVSPKSASKGDTVTITVKPDKGYELDTLKILDKDGDRVKFTEKKGKYTFTMPASKVTVKGKFVEEAPEQIFADVPVDAYCYEAVKWAASEGITGGIGNNLFAPDRPCTRGQIVTFLWRAAGSPAPKNMSSFTDVPADAFYAKAVAWAVENGITGGTGDGKFSPDATCTRAQSVTFLYRAAGSPKVSGSAEFGDVATNAYYADAVAWAAKNGITGGIGGGLFGSGSDCTRGQIVTFLYRSVK